MRAVSRLHRDLMPCMGSKVAALGGALDCPDPLPAGDRADPMQPVQVADGWAGSPQQETVRLPRRRKRCRAGLAQVVGAEEVTPCSSEGARGPGGRGVSAGRQAQGALDGVVVSQVVRQVPTGEEAGSSRAAARRPPKCWVWFGVLAAWVGAALVGVGALGGADLLHVRGFTDTPHASLRPGPVSNSPTQSAMVEGLPTMAEGDGVPDGGQVCLPTNREAGADAGTVEAVQDVMAHPVVYATSPTSPTSPAHTSCSYLLGGVGRGAEVDAGAGSDEVFDDPAEEIATLAHLWQDLDQAMAEVEAFDASEWTEALAAAYQDAAQAAQELDGVLHDAEVSGEFSVFPLQTEAWVRAGLEVLHRLVQACIACTRPQGWCEVSR